MLSKNCFIKATEEYNSFEKNVPAYYFRRAYFSPKERKVTLRIAACGFYELYFNREKITRGFLSPYISNPDDIVYYDEYEVTLREGENVFGIHLGNGFQNNPGGYIWDFDKAPFRSAPMLAFSVSCGDELLLSSDESFKTAPSPIISDDYRFGEHYDARCETEGWNEVGFDSTGWGNALVAEPPKGELRRADVPPIVKEGELRPVLVTPSSDGGYIYDFGVSNAGVCRLTVKGDRGQRIELRHADSLENGDLNLAQIWFPDREWERDREIVHMDSYVCRGVGTEIYQPSFTYHGFRYVKVNGIRPEQATEGLLRFIVYHTALTSVGGFECSDPIATALGEMTRRSIVSNLYHFPTDCPQREKNGWTADAALSCEAALLNFDPERNYREWMRNICKAQREDGALPGIVPTGGWGFSWGNGPAWDSVLAYLPYYVYIYRGKTEMIAESKETFIKYLRYLRGRTDRRGLLEIGLGDWCHVGRIPPKAPLVLTDSIMAMDIAEKIAFMLDNINMHEDAEYARAQSESYRRAIRESLIDFESMKAVGDCQTSQAMCLYYGVFDRSEENAAFAVLLDNINNHDGHIDVGVLGGRVLFHVLSRFGYGDLAFKMITREDYPSFGNWIKRGATTMWEDFFPDRVSSMNHHFWGDISAWFIKRVAGIELNPSRNNVNEVKIAPSFIDSLDHASAYHNAPGGRISSGWRRAGENITLDIEIPDGVKAEIELPSGFAFEGGENKKATAGGSYRIVRK